jgi:type IV secretory pathway VirB2 component (pilin)
MKNTIAASYNNSQMRIAGKTEYLILLALCGIFLSILLVGNAYADAGTNLENAICKISIVAQTNVAKGIATLAIIMLGIGAMLGKVSWSMALLVAVGIAVVFNAGAIVGSLGSTQCTGVN